MWILVREDGRDTSCSLVGVVVGDRVKVALIRSMNLRVRAFPAITEAGGGVLWRDRR